MIKCLCFLGISMCTQNFLVVLGKQKCIGSALILIIIINNHNSQTNTVDEFVSLTKLQRKGVE